MSDLHSWTAETDWFPQVRVRTRQASTGAQNSPRNTQQCRQSSNDPEPEVPRPRRPRSVYLDYILQLILLREMLAPVFKRPRRAALERHLIRHCIAINTAGHLAQTILLLCILLMLTILWITLLLH